ncbi:conserved hypothetical protein [Leishmania major strain Friedlin]|uniref:Uncharacterized protein n=1 Tax=Leishmania major TaxID=5664 RepID=Q4QFM1_LEIMA|nr:conserved hypothetical protein [Leishmania major strain Friedlin]CAG9571306.1 hypothetical_protein_-_conserved [Leishmania major strain Friedlin]CAJ03175.1 conserved hypothetical protein [Leishmania major strain Friedlin]|eukprot:XP_001687713.1 conserved hypothetical protein [Leishmania major strain Friedlin]
MDLAEKRKQLEALRAARQAKQQVVEQYISGRSSNPDGSPTSSTSLSRSALALALPASAAAGDSAAAAGTSTSPRSALPLSLRSRSGGGRLSVSSTRGSAATAKAAAPSAASSPVTPTTPTAQKARPTTPSKQSAPSQTQAAAADGGVAPRSIHFVSMNKDSTAAHAAMAGFSAASPNARPVVGSLCGSALPTVASRAAAAPPTEEGLAAYGGWGFLRKCMRVPARDATGATVTQPVCIFNPSVLLGDVAGSVESSRRRVILDSTSCLVPYDGAAAGQRLSDGAMMTLPTVWSVCVAAAYGSCDSPAVTSGGNGGELSVNTRCHGNTDPAGPDNRTGASALDPLFMLSTGGTSVGMSQQRASAAARPATGAAAAAAAARVRASMDFGYPWGSASAAPSAVPGATTESALKVAKESPGLVLAWLLVPLPANTMPRKEGSFAGAAAAPGGGFVSCVSGDITTMPEHVVIVLPLVCDSEVTTLLAHPLQPSTLLGGTRCGRIVQWSIGQAWAQIEPRRLLERALATTGTTTTLLLPPQRPAHSSFPSPQAHQAPVLRMAVHGDASCHHLYSISQEGKVCTWTASQPLHPAASCLSYLGIRPMGCIGVTAQFVERAGTDAMTKVFIGTTSGALLVGANRDAKSIELQYYGPPRALPTSSTVIRTLDITATSVSTASFRDGAAATASTCLTASLAHPAGADAFAAAEESGHHHHHHHHLTAVSSPSPATAAVARRVQAAALQPHRGRIVSMAVQTATHGLRGRDCVVSAATDGSCVAWFDRSVIPLEGFSSAVTSVCWSPTKQGVLAAGDASGLVTVWAVSTSIITPVVTVSLREAGHRARGNASSDGVLWVVPGTSDAAAGAGSGTAGGGTFGFGGDDDEADVFDGEEVGASLGEADVVGTAISSVFFSRDGQWLFASTARGYVHTLHLGTSLV